jgi:hypothetical protein
MPAEVPATPACAARMATGAARAAQESEAGAFRPGGDCVGRAGEDQGWQLLALVEEGCSLGQRWPETNKFMVKLAERTEEEVGK